MKKLATFLATVLLSIASSAHAGAGTNTVVCVDFDFFCDGLELSINPGEAVTGFWRNTDCAGTDVAVTGRVGINNTLSVLCADFATCPVGNIWLFKVLLSSRTFNLFGWDGVNPPFPAQVNSPYTLTQGACAFGEKTGVPSTLAR
jgi:hypothetical protein